jgi:hypothetical protein
MFALLYVAPRSVYRFEDDRYRATWVSMGAAFIAARAPAVLTGIRGSPLPRGQSSCC